MHELPTEKGKLNVELPVPLLRELGRAQQVAVHACEGDWSLSPQQLTELHAFAEKYAAKAPESLQPVATTRRAAFRLPEPHERAVPPPPPSS